jgi:hypothetical protein
MTIKTLSNQTLTTIGKGYARTRLHLTGDVLITYSILSFYQIATITAEPAATTQHHDVVPFADRTASALSSA